MTHKSPQEIAEDITCDQFANFEFSHGEDEFLKELEGKIAKAIEAERASMSQLRHNLLEAREENTTFRVALDKQAELFRDRAKILEDALDWACGCELCARRASEALLKFRSS